jgi:hypothetical protein
MTLIVSRIIRKEAHGYNSVNFIRKTPLTR